MLTRLELEGFKNFRKATLDLGPLTVLVGANAAGKSNIRDALRFLHGISRGYSLAEIIGEKYGPGGEQIWAGIRGGNREIFFDSKHFLRIDVEARCDASLITNVVTSENYREFEYNIRVTADVSGESPRTIYESLYFPLANLGSPQGGGHFAFQAYAMGSGTSPAYAATATMVYAVAATLLGSLGNVIEIRESGPILSMVLDEGAKFIGDPEAGVRVRHELGSMRFLDLNPEAMRRPSLPGQTILGDRGENLASVLHAICQDETSKATLLDWVRELTPMDAADFEFPADPTGRIMLMLVERSGRKITAYSASDGTLRFLAIIAALLGPHPASFYFFEEIDNGIHPARLHLLLQLIEQVVANRIRFSMPRWCIACRITRKAASNGSSTFPAPRS
ncbi:MAG: AAA family ATPase [Magnetospirillum sp. WYHS-4]